VTTFVDTAGWDWIVSSSAEAVNTQIQGSNQPPLTFCFSETPDKSGLVVSGKIGGFRLCNGLGLMPAITLQVTDVELLFSSSGNDSHLIKDGILTLNLLFPISVKFPAPVRVPDNILYHPDGKPSSQDIAHHEKLTLEINGALLDTLSDQRTEQLRYVMAAGFRANLGSLLQWLAAPLCFSFRPFPSDNETLFDIARFALIITEIKGDLRVYRYFYLLLEPPYNVLQPEEINNLQTIIPEQLSCQGDAEYVALSPRLFPTFAFTDLLTEALVRSQLPPDMLWSYLSTSVTVDTLCIVNLIEGLNCTQQEKNWQPCLVSASEVIHLNLRNAENNLPIAIDKFDAALEGDTLILNYRWRDLVLPFGHHHVEQRFSLSLTNASDIRGANLALVLRQTGIEKKTDREFFLNEFLVNLSNVYYTTLNLSSRLAGVLSYIPLKLAAFHPDGLPVQMETGYKHGGGIIRVTSS